MAALDVCSFPSSCSVRGSCPAPTSTSASFWREQRGVLRQTPRCVWPGRLDGLVIRSARTGRGDSFAIRGASVGLDLRPADLSSLRLRRIGRYSRPNCNAHPARRAGRRDAQGTAAGERAAGGGRRCWPSKNCSTSRTGRPRFDEHRFRPRGIVTHKPEFVIDKQLRPSPVSDKTDPRRRPLFLLRSSTPITLCPCPSNQPT